MAGNAGISGVVQFGREALDQLDDDSSGEEGGAGEADETPDRTIEQLRSGGDPNAVDRTPVFEQDDIPVRAGQWPLGFPIQGIPRIAAVVNLNYVYDDDRDEWVRDTGNRRLPDATAKRASAPSQTIPDSIFGSPVSFAGFSINTLGASGPNQETIQLPTDGIYRVQTNVTLDAGSGSGTVRLTAKVDTKVDIAIDEKDTDVAVDKVTLSASGTAELPAGTNVTAEIDAVGSESFTLETLSYETFIEVSLLEEV